MGFNSGFKGLMVTPGFFCLLVCSFFYSIPGNLFWGILFICCNQCLLYACILSKNRGYIQFFCSLCVCCMICPCVSCCVSHTFHLCCCYSSGVSCFYGPIFSTVSQSWKGQCIVQFYSCFIYSFLWYTSVIFKWLFSLLSMSTSFSQDIKFCKQLKKFTCSIILLSVTILLLSGSRPLTL